MSDEMQIDGKSYVSSKRAAETSGYAQDYIGQLSRKGLIDARRIGGLWYVCLESLEEYKKKAEEYKPTPPTSTSTTPEPATLIFFDGKEYLSAARAAQETGYAQDYVGQLARSNAIQSRQVGNRWYVERDSIVAHKKEKDALLASVQREAVGLKMPESPKTAAPENALNSSYIGQEPLLNYFSDESDLLPVPSKQTEPVDEVSVQNEPISAITPIPIQRVQTPKFEVLPPARAKKVVAPALLPVPRANLMPILIGAVATIVIVLSVGYASVLKQNSVYATVAPASTNTASLTASVYQAVARIGDALEPWLTHELTYQRVDQ